MKINPKMTMMIKMRTKYNGPNDKISKINLVHGDMYDIIVSRTIDEVGLPAISLRVLKGTKIEEIVYEDLKVFGQEWGRIAKQANEILFDLESNE